MFLRAVLPGLLLTTCVAAQTAQTLLLPDFLDLRPAGARLQARLQELNAEAQYQTSINNPATAAAIQGVVANLQAMAAGSTPLPPPTGLEFHVVTFYEGDSSGNAVVEVDRPGVPVVLVLNAYDPIQWTLSETQGSLVLAVIAYSYEPQTLAGLPGAFKVQTSYTANGLGDYFGLPDDPTDPEARFRACKWCLERLNALPATFVGDYSAPAGTFRVGSTNPDWLEQMVVRQALNEGATWNTGTRSVLQATFQGAAFLPLLAPAQGSAALPVLAVASPLSVLQPLLQLPGVSGYAIGTGFSLFTLGSGGPASFDLPTLTSQLLPTSGGFPLSFTNTITFDLLRNRLVLTSFQGSGTMYAWDLATSSWTALAPLNNNEPRALAYHAAYDALFGVAIDVYGAQPYELQRFDPNGNLVATLPLPLPLFDDLFETHQLYPLGSALAYVGPARTIFGFAIRHSFVIDPATGNVIFAGYLLG